MPGIEWYQYQVKSSRLCIEWQLTCHKNNLEACRTGWGSDWSFGSCVEAILEQEQIDVSPCDHTEYFAIIASFLDGMRSFARWEPAQHRHSAEYRLLRYSDNHFKVYLSRRRSVEVVHVAAREMKKWWSGWEARRDASVFSSPFHSFSSDMNTPK